MGVLTGFEISIMGDYTNIGILGIPLKHTRSHSLPKVKAKATQLQSGFCVNTEAETEL